MSRDAERLAKAFGGAGRIESLDAPPQSILEAYGLQDRVREAIGRPIKGWKLAATRPAAQEKLGIEAPTISPLLEGMIVPSDTIFPSSRFYVPEVEGEVAFEVARPIRKPMSASGLIDRLRGLRIAVEVADTRFADKAAQSVYSTIADMNSSGALVIGPLLDLKVLSQCLGQGVNSRLGDGTVVGAVPDELRPKPFETFSTLVAFVIERGHVLNPGDIVTTGTHTPPTRSGPGLIGTEFPQVGKVSARLSAAWS